MDVRGKNVLVVGMARSGVAAAKLAVQQGAVVTCTDRRPDAPVVEGSRAAYGGHARADFLSADLIVVSPGVPASQPDLVAAAEAGVPLLGELAFAASFLTHVPMYAVSGTNGKSTTTALLGQLLAQGGHTVFTGGNLGQPLSEAVLSPTPWTALAVEVSSYQMELPGDLHPRGAVILNLTPDHLERHKTMDNYGAHKCRLFTKMGPDDIAVLPADDARLTRLAQGAPGQRLYLEGEPGVQILSDRLVFSGVPDPGELPLAGFALPGHHNVQNLAAALLLANHAGVRRDMVQLDRLIGLEHRLEPVGVVAGARWFNDSKATNVDSTLVALAALAPVGPLIVLLGGRGKAGAPYEALVSPLRSARAVLCFGETGPEIAQALAAGGLGSYTCAGLSAAMEQAAQMARPGDIVLLSPACASFDEFTDFEHRGRVFSARVREMADAQG